MPLAPGLFAMPTVLANTALSFVKDRSYPVHSTDTLAVVSPMYNEEKGAAKALRSLLEQDVAPDQIALSINGGSDATYEVVSGLLGRKGYIKKVSRSYEALQAVLEIWLGATSPSFISVLRYSDKVSKSQSINTLVEQGIVRADRILVLDGDTVLHPGFVRYLRDNFYRLRVHTSSGARRFVLEDYGLQSGWVTSYAPKDASLQGRFISAGRKAEYAFSGVLRSGQAKQLGRSALWGNSRLYTVIGCGFAARRDLFPIPTRTETEDHDFTLMGQNTPPTLERLSRAELARRGFKIVVDGEALAPEAFFDKEDMVKLKRGGNARFVEEALMLTEDPPHFNGFIRQVERWNGGGQQNVLERFGRPLAPQVRFALWTALFENILGLFILSLVPLAVALHAGNSSLGLPLSAVALWLGFDGLLTFLFVGYGTYRQSKAARKPWWEALARGLRLSLRTTLPFLVLRYINPVTYVASATRVLPRHFFTRRNPRDTGVVWERSHLRRQTRTEPVFVWTLLVFGASALGVAALAPQLNPINEEAWRLTHNAPFVDMRDFDHVSFMVEPSAKPSPQPELEPPTLVTERPPRRGEPLSGYCEPETLRVAAPEPLRLRGEAEAYRPLNRWSLLTLARLAPLLAYIENAATAYNVPVDFYLMVLLNESYLDPLAIGETDDKGLSQVTSDALTLLKALAQDRDSPYYNPQLFPALFSVFDADFSLCAGAAKLAWARSQAGVTNEAEAYALFINPVHGFAGGRISERHLPLTEAMLSQAPMVAALANTLALYHEHPDQLSDPERKLLNTAAFVHRGYLSLEDAYRVSFEVVQSVGLKDTEMYKALFSRYFGDVSAGT